MTFILNNTIYLDLLVLLDSSTVVLQLYTQCMDFLNVILTNGNTRSERSNIIRHFVFILWSVIRILYRNM